MRSKWIWLLLVTVKKSHLTYIDETNNSTSDAQLVDNKKIKSILETLVKKKDFNNANVTFFNAKIEEISYFGLMKIKFDAKID